MIDRCKSAGYGWRKFAESVEKQGSCSDKQDSVLVSMFDKITLHEFAVNGNFKYSKRIDFPFDGELDEPCLNEI